MVLIEIRSLCKGMRGVLEKKKSYQEWSFFFWNVLRVFPQTEYLTTNRDGKSINKDKFDIGDF